MMFQNSQIRLIYRHIVNTTTTHTCCIGLLNSADMYKNGGTDDRPIEWPTWCAKLQDRSRCSCGIIPRHDWFTDIVDTKPTHACCIGLLNARRYGVSKRWNRSRCRLADLWLFQGLSVCVGVSVTLRYCVKTAKRRITQIMPRDSDIL